MAPSLAKGRHQPEPRETSFHAKLVRLERLLQRRLAPAALHHMRETPLGIANLGKRREQMLFLLFNRHDGRPALLIEF